MIIDLNLFFTLGSNNASHHSLNSTNCCDTAVWQISCSLLQIGFHHIITDVAVTYDDADDDDDDDDDERRLI